MASIFSDILNWLKMHQLPCPVRYYLHFDCPGCGLQRSTLALLRGDLLASWQLHPATVPLLLFLLFAALHLKYKFPKGNIVGIYGSIFIATIILSNYIYKIISHHLV